MSFFFAILTRHLIGQPQVCLVAGWEVPQGNSSSTSFTSSTFSITILRIFRDIFLWTRVYSPPPVTPPFEEIYFAENKLQFWGVPPTHKSAKYYLTSSLNHTQIWISLKIFTIYLIFWPLQYHFLMFVLFLPKIIPTFLLNIDPLTLIHRIQINYNFSIHP